MGVWVSKMKLFGHGDMGNMAFGSSFIGKTLFLGLGLVLSGCVIVYVDKVSVPERCDVKVRLDTLKVQPIPPGKVEQEEDAVGKAIEDSVRPSDKRW